MKLLTLKIYRQTIDFKLETTADLIRFANKK